MEGACASLPYFCESVPRLLARIVDKDIWLNVFRRGLKNLDSVLNRVGKSEISQLNWVRV